MIIVQTKNITRQPVNVIMKTQQQQHTHITSYLPVSPAQEMLSASISQTRILQTCAVPHPVSGTNLQGNVQIHTSTNTHIYKQTHT